MVGRIDQYQRCGETLSEQDMEELRRHLNSRHSKKAHSGRIIRYVPRGMGAELSRERNGSTPSSAIFATKIIISDNTIR